MKYEDGALFKTPSEAILKFKRNQAGQVPCLVIEGSNTLFSFLNDEELTQTIMFGMLTPYTPPEPVEFSVECLHGYREGVRWSFEDYDDVDVVTIRIPLPDYKDAEKLNIGKPITVTIRQEGK